MRLISDQQATRRILLRRLVETLMSVGVFKAVAVPVVAGLAIVAFSIQPATSQTSIGKELRQRYEATNPYTSVNGADQFRVRISEYPETNGDFIAGAYYVFESLRGNADSWNHIMTVLLDDPDPIPCSHLRFLDTEKAYVFLQASWSLTTDGGRSWHTVDLRHTWPDWRNRNLKISEVDILGNGIGTMDVTLFNPETHVRLRTRDYGMHWEH